MMKTNNKILLKLLFLCFLAISLSACSTQLKNEGKAVENGKELGLEDYDEGNTAPGAAYLVDAIHIRKPMKSRDWKPIEFYYKHCSDIGSKAYYSKTSYDCTGPY